MFMLRTVAVSRQRLLAFVRSPAIRCPRILLPVLVAAVYLLVPMLAYAGDFACVESSKYKYIFRLFNNDPKEAAKYLGIDPAQSPPPEACRAVVFTGGVEQGDAAKLIGLIAQNRGWSAQLYLSSGGGSVDEGLRLAMLTRAFWLKTIVAPAKSFRYQPDFMPTLTVRSDPANPNAAARQAFQKAIEAVPETTVSFAACASACTFSLAAGVDRHGVGLAHRAGVSGSSIEAVAEGVGHAMSLMTGLYQKMDVGDDFVQAARSTAKQTTTPVTVTRYPRFVEDFLVEKCKSDAAQLEDLEALLQHGIVHGGYRTADLVQTKTLRESLGKVEARRQNVEQCVAAYHERERLNAFNRLCAHGCSGKSLEPFVAKQLSELKG